MSSLDGMGKLDRSARTLSPLIVALLLALVSMVPVRLNHFGSIVPSIGLMAVFYWAVWRPDLFGPVAAFCLGFVHDVLSGAPVGLNALICLLAYGSVVNQRQLFLAHSFFVLWWGYALVALFAAATAWLAHSLLQGVLVPFEPALFQAFAGMALFPVVAWICHRVQHGFLGGL
jgi:rod shape-determining protein MreD